MKVSNSPVHLGQSISLGIVFLLTSLGIMLLTALMIANGS